MTNHELKCIFIHLSRTGGSSIEKFLMGTDDIYGPRESWCDYGLIREHHHCSYDEYKRRNGDKILNDYFTFSFIRNPWDRFVSSFHWDLYQYEKAKSEGRSIKERRVFIVKECNSDFQTYVKNGSLRPNWFKFTQAKEYAGDVDYIGRLESLHEDMRYICNRLGIVYTGLSHENKTKREHYTKYYDNKSSEIVYNLFKEDIEHFGYSYGK